MSTAHRALRGFRQLLRRLLAWLPRHVRFALYRNLVDCDTQPDARLVVKIAQSRDELEACFALLHDVYVENAFMQPHPSGLRVTPYHALPTTTTICACWDGRVVGTISMVRDGVFGFPMQQAFNLKDVRNKGGQIAEVSALAVHPDFRRSGGAILFPLLKFMYLYCTRCFDTQHLVIAVHPNRIELYESLLFFERLQANVVDCYDFANGAPAIGATLDLRQALLRFERAYAHKPPAKNLYAYFTQLELPNIALPARRYFTTNDPVLTPALFGYFFRQRVPVLDGLSARQLELLRAIYVDEPFRALLPATAARPVPQALRRHQRFSIRLPARVQLEPDDGEGSAMFIVEISSTGFQGECADILPLDIEMPVRVQLGDADVSTLRATPVWRHAMPGLVAYGFRVVQCDGAWTRCVGALQAGLVDADLQQAA